MTLNRSPEFHGAFVQIAYVKETKVEGRQFQKMTTDSFIRRSKKYRGFMFVCFYFFLIN